MPSRSTCKMILNETPDHARIVNTALKSAINFRCCVAFAKKSGWALLEEQVKKRLKGGLQATFVVGIDFFQSDPDLLDELFRLQQRYSDRMKLFMGSYPGTYTFHPKVYVLEGGESTTIVVGSANLTGGGLGDNHEMSLAITEPGKSLAHKVDKWIADLQQDGDIVQATRVKIDKYRKQHAIARVQANLAARRTRRALTDSAAGLNKLGTLQDILREMKSDSSPEGFEAQVRERKDNRLQAGRVLRQIAEDGSLTERRFSDYYEQLVSGLWHSGGLHRGKTKIAPYYEHFQRALRGMESFRSMNASEAFRTLHTALAGVERTGTNVITEILHTLDNDHFAVMNQNSVAGLRLAGVSDFPEKPNRFNVTPETYASFCRSAKEVRDGLGLTDFTQLDAVFNYAYWSDDRVESVDNDIDEVD
jgi:HKD family nuclease